MCSQYFIILLSILLGLAGPGWAVQRFAGPTGSGTTCSTGTPCTVNTAISQAVAGDEVILKNGTYETTINTVRNGALNNPITIRAENLHQAIVTPPANWTPGNFNVSPPAVGSGQYVKILHSHITLRGVILDAEDRAYAITRIAGNGGVVTTNVILENTIQRNPQAQHLNMSLAKNIIIRHNLQEDVIRTEGWYIGSSGVVENLQAYGNTIQDCGSNTMDFKNTLNADIHHNILERQWRGAVVAQDGIITFSGRGQHFHNNIIRNSLADSAVFDYVGLFDNHNIHNNVAHNITNAPQILWYESTPNPTTASKFQNNTFCSTASGILQRHTSGSSQTPAGLTISGNLFNQAQGVCDIEVARIIDETTDLPGFSGEIIITIDPPNNLAVVSITN